MTGIKDYSTTPVTDDSYFPEHQSPSSVNNGLRQLKADLREWYNDAEWVEYGVGDSPSNGGAAYTFTYVSTTEFRLATGDVRTAYHAGRQLRLTGDSLGILYGEVVSSSYNSSSGYTAVTATWRSGSLSSDATTRVWLGAQSAVNPSFPPRALYQRNVDLGGADLNDARLGRYSQKRADLTIDTGAVTWDLTEGNAGYLTLTEDVTAFTIINWPQSPNVGSFSLWVQQDSTGGWVMSGWPSSAVWLGGGTAPTITATAFAVDVVVFQTLDGGANILGTVGQNAPFAGLIGS
jgi:hypothetical protein